MAYLTQTQTGQPALILKEGTSRSRGKEAQRNNIMAAKVIAETVRSTLGPRGMDKMTVDSLGDITITNDAGMTSSWSSFLVIGSFLAGDTSDVLASVTFPFFLFFSIGSVSFFTFSAGLGFFIVHVLTAFTFLTRISVGFFQFHLSSVISDF